MNRNAAGSWITLFKRSEQSSIRLFCFPYAGAGTSIFRTWTSALPAEIEVCGIQYPGRESRSDEQPFQELEPLIDALIPSLLPWLNKPFAFFGHSMGALLCYELTRALNRGKGVGPEHVFFSGAGAPHIPEPHPIHQLPDREFLSELVKMNGIQPDVLGNADLMGYMLPILRADLNICETYSYQAAGPLQCPISAFGGDCDFRVDKRRVVAWSDHASVYFSSTIFHGDHFFLRSAKPALLSAIAHELSPLIRAVCRPGAQAKT